MEFLLFVVCSNSVLSSAMPVLQRISFITFICLLFTQQSGAQCLCADMRFRIVVPGLQYREGQTNYRLHTLTRDIGFGNDHFYPSQIKGDTLSFSYPTGGGIDTLIFRIESPNRGKYMQVYVLNMHYDIDYFIDLTTFTPGAYLFDWASIGACQQAQRKDTLVHCEGAGFLQLKLVDPQDPYWPQSFVHHLIRPHPLQSFSIKK
ncbi:MAG TPA: hypothetical protein VL092_11370 [Chitinophagaceae bacterium]|nr:hypothetical protein [Chitinophagaceae bacterium]